MLINLLSNCFTFVLFCLPIQVEATNQVIAIEQSQADRSKKTFDPVK
jgi:hypothetical protein